jgi:hypothetical protein
MGGAFTSLVGAQSQGSAPTVALDDTGEPPLFDRFVAQSRAMLSEGRNPLLGPGGATDDIVLAAIGGKERAKAKRTGRPPKTGSSAPASKPRTLTAKAARATSDAALPTSGTKRKGRTAGGAAPKRPGPKTARGRAATKAKLTLASAIHDDPSNAGQDDAAVQACAQRAADTVAADSTTTTVDAAAAATVASAASAAPTAADDRLGASNSAMGDDDDAAGMMDAWGY